MTKITDGFTYYLGDKKDMTEEDKIRQLINKFESRFNFKPVKLYLNPKSNISQFPGIEIIITTKVLPNNYHFSLE